jgi:hypothetical protein
MKDHMITELPSSKGKIDIAKVLGVSEGDILEKIQGFFESTPQGTGDIILPLILHCLYQIEDLKKEIEGLKEGLKPPNRFESYD